MSWRRATLGVVAVLVGAAGGERAHAGDPERVWQTLESAHFVFHFDARTLDVARRVAQVAERAHRTLAPALGHDPEGKTQVVLLDETDGANGFANVLPRNAITLYLTAPSGASNLADHDDWLYTLFAHEYTHVLHLDTMSGLPPVYNSIFGKTWAPNQVMPRWVIEGLATYSESKRSAGGRTRNTTFDMYLRVPTLRGDALRLDQISNPTIRYPRGNAAYLYGSHFLRYVFDRFGDATLRRMSQTSGATPIPFGTSRQLAAVVGEPLDELYDDWRDHRRDRYALQAQAVERRGVREGRKLTTSGETNLAPRYTPDGRELVWLAGDGRDRTALRTMPVGTDERASRELVRIDGLGAWTIAADGALVYEQSRPYRRDYQFQDLFRWDPATGLTRRLTTGARARDPAVSPDLRRVAVSRNGTSRSDLAVMPMTGGAEPRVVWRGPGRFDQAFQPAWSPDGQRLAVSAWRAGGYRDVLIVDVATGAATELTQDRAIEGSPVWSRDGRYLYFDSDRTGINNIFAYELATGALWQVTDVLGGAFEAAVSPDGRRLAYHGFTGQGHDLFEIAIEPATWRPAPTYLDDRPPPTAIADDEVPVDGPRPYRAAETLAPLTWQADVALSTVAQGMTLRTAGDDAAGLHRYTVAAGLDFERGDVDLVATYGYSGWRPSVRVAGSRLVTQRTGYRIDGRSLPYLEETFGGTLSVGLPSERPPGAAWTLSADYDADYSRIIDDPFDAYDPTEILPRPPVSGYYQAGVGLRLGYSSARGTTYAIGPTEGFDLSASTRFDHPIFGARFRTLTVSWSARAYARVPLGQASTVALRVAGAIRTSDQVRTGVYSLGGVPAQDLVASLVQNLRAGTTGYLRGYPSRSVVGNQFHLANLEVRRELWSIERGLATVPVYVKRLHAVGLADAGTAFDTAFDADRVRASVGAALRLDGTFGYYLDGTLELGYARGLVNDGIGESWLLLTGTL
ncbi:MAG: hypothetical protein R2939_05200 [Kofleriaceae bacterium]